MLGTHLLGTANLGTEPRRAATVSSATISFDGFSLQSDAIVTTVLQASSAPSRELEIAAAPRDDGQRITGDFYRERRIQIQGMVKKSTADELEDFLDEIKHSLSGREGDLDIVTRGQIRRFRATLANPDQIFAAREGHHITTCPIALEFLTVSPFAQSPTHESQTFFDLTAASFAEQITSSGTAPAKAVFSLSLSAGSGVSAVSVKNSKTDEMITIAEPLAAGSLLRIDGENREVTIDGAVVDYAGVFPRILPKSNAVTVTIDGTGVVYTFTAKHRPAYL